jgi:sodium transport system permease protein
VRSRFGREALAVFRKETRDHLRDRRSLASALVVPLFYPLLVGVLFTLMASWFTSDQPLDIAVRGQENAPGLIDFLTRHGAQVHVAAADLEARVKAGDDDVALIIPPDYARHFRAGEPAEVEVVHDGSRNRTHHQVERANRLLQTYSGQIGALRLIARGVTPGLVSTLDVADDDVSTKREQGANLLNLIPLMLLVAAVLGGMHAAIDATAGERERGSLEALLITPVARTTLVLGKWLSAGLLALVGVCVALAGFVVAVRFIPLEDLGVRATLGLREVGLMLVAIVPLVCFTTALQLLVSSFAKSFKEAQTYVSMIALAPSLPGMILSFVPLKPTLWMYLVPALGQQLLMVDVMRGTELTWGDALCTVAAALVAAALCLALLVRLLGRETTLANA